MIMKLTDRRDLRWPFEFRERSELRDQKMHITIFIDFFEEGKASIDCGTIQMTVDQWQAYRASLGWVEPLSATLQEQIESQRRDAEARNQAVLEETRG